MLRVCNEERAVLSQLAFAGLGSRRQGDAERGEGWTYASDLAKDGSHVAFVVFLEDIGRRLVLERDDLLDRRACEEQPDVRKPTAVTKPGVEAWRHCGACQVWYSCWSESCRSSQQISMSNSPHCSCVDRSCAFEAVCLTAFLMF